MRVSKAAWVVIARAGFDPTGEWFIWDQVHNTRDSAIAEWEQFWGTTLWAVPWRKPRRRGIVMAVHVVVQVADCRLRDALIEG